MYQAYRAITEVTKPWERASTTSYCTAGLTRSPVMRSNFSWHRSATDTIGGVMSTFSMSQSYAAGGRDTLYQNVDSPSDRKQPWLRRTSSSFTARCHRSTSKVATAYWSEHFLVRCS